MINILFFILIFLFTITVHEYAHGRVAYAFGDTTAKDVGRLTLNPLKHIDPLWTIVLPFTLLALGLPAIGMAKPVPVNFRNLARPKRDMIWVALAGPTANILFAAFLTILFKLFPSFLLLLGIYFNLGLAIFNLIPIPPLDGSRILAGLLPPAWAYQIGRLESMGFLIILLLFWFRVLHALIIPGMNFFCRILDIPPLPF